MLMDRKFHSLYQHPEIWGGIECTINRVENTYQDQLAYANFYTRENDIENFAALGIKALRYPVLWEFHQPETNTKINWDWSEKKLNTINSFSITPIVGLLHHGSGPRYTSLLDKNFAESLASYAGKVAQKFPWLTYYTPVNEPLTTARFSGMYGIWYPHKRNDIYFARMFLNEMKAVVLSMDEIRKINPEAKLIQTEDLGKTYSSQLLKYQADFENERRWLTYDILFGKLNKDHPLWHHFIRLGIPQKDLEFFLKHTCPPAIMGFNHYVTSERYIDDNLTKYPSHTYGSNEVHEYADVEAIRVDHEQPSGLKHLLQEAWNRFKWPMALTEVHLHCGREEQLRWFKEAWDTCVALNQSGLEIQAITAWSLLGAFGWNRLLAHPHSDYEPGVFDLRSPNPRPTGLAKLIQSLNKDPHYTHPILNQEGWWQREHRFLNGCTPKVGRRQKNEPSPVLIVGKTGTLGLAFERLCSYRGIRNRLVGREDIDILREETIEHAINAFKPWAIINAAGYVRIDEAETEREKCFSVNTKGSGHLANACNKHGIKLMTFSSDLVFDGKKNAPYLESDAVSPLSIYGKSKALSDKIVIRDNANALIIRTSSFFSPWDNYNFAIKVLRTLKNNGRFICADNVTISPTYVPDLVDVSIDLLVDDESGIWHITNQGEITWKDFGEEIAQRCGLNRELVNGKPGEEMEWKATRPKYSALHSGKGIFMPSLDNALSRFSWEKEMVL